MPTEINPWLKDWWDVIWQDFSWSQDIPYCDFDIKGQWLNRKKRTRTYGTVEVSNISYRDLPLDKGSLKVIVDEKKTRITEINLFPPTGKVEGQLSFPRSSSNQPLILGFDLKGEINPGHCRKAFGPVAEKALTRFDTNSTVKVIAKGQLLLTNDGIGPHERASAIAGAEAVLVGGVGGEPAYDAGQRPRRNHLEGEDVGPGGGFPRSPVDQVHAGRHVYVRLGDVDEDPVQLGPVEADVGGGGGAWLWQVV